MQTSMPQLRRLQSAHLPRRRRRVVASVAATWRRRERLDLVLSLSLLNTLVAHDSNAARETKSDLYTYMQTFQITLATLNMRQ